MTGGDGDVKAAAASPPPPLEWKFSQVFGERTAGEEVQEGKVGSRLNLMILCELLVCDSLDLYIS